MIPYAAWSVQGKLREVISYSEEGSRLVDRSWGWKPDFSKCTFYIVLTFESCARSTDSKRN